MSMGRATVLAETYADRRDGRRRGVRREGRRPVRSRRQGRADHAATRQYRGELDLGWPYSDGCARPGAATDIERSHSTPGSRPVQEMQAERAVEALAAFLPATARVVRDGTRCEIAARDLVPGDMQIVAERDRV
jgi:hypothetical protein